MTVVTAPPIGAKKKSRKLLMLALASGVLLGAAGGAGIWYKFDYVKSVIADHTGAKKPKAPVSSLQEMPIGKIMVQIKDPEAKSKHHMLLELVLVYDPTLDDEPQIKGQADLMPGRHAQIRDSFIEYLSQLTMKESQGTSGLATIRTELLRRARLVSGNDAPQAILIQDFVLQ